MPVKKLVMRRGRMKKENTIIFPKGYEWLMFVDPETNIQYVPKESFVVTGENLEDLFDEDTDPEAEDAEWVD